MIPVGGDEEAGGFPRRGATRPVHHTRRIALETLTGFKRAGIDIILTYHAPDVARWLMRG